MGCGSLVCGRCGAASSAEFADFAQGGLVDDFDATSVNGKDFLVHEGREGADGVAGGHVREVGDVFARHVDLDGGVVVLVSIVLAQDDERFGQAAAYVFLCEVDDACVGATEVVREFFDEEPGEFDVVADEVFDEAHGYGAEGGGFEGAGRRHVLFVGEAGAVAEILDGAEESQNLLAAADAVFVHLHFALEQAPQVLGFFALGVDDLVLLEVVYLKIVHNASSLFVVKNGPDSGQILIYDFFDSGFKHRLSALVQKFWNLNGESQGLFWDGLDTPYVVQHANITLF